VSEDPLFNAIARDTTKYGRSQNSLLSNPQELNSYSYAVGNPIGKSDPTGLWFKEFFTGQQSWSSFQGEIGEAAMYMGSGWQKAMDHPVAAGVMVGVGGGLAAAGGSAILTAASTAWFGGAGMGCLAMCGKAIDTAQRISISAERYQHVLDRHGYDTLQKNVSTFNKGLDIKSLIGQASKVAPRVQSNGNLERIFNVGKNIGLDRVTGKPTSIITVITNKASELITSFPGRSTIK
jgi:hypothetical protein